METSSVYRDKEKSFDWIVRVLNTCTSTFHFEAIENLIVLFYQKYNDQALRVELDLLKARKWNEVHQVLT
jgi:hypothetical protein